MFLADQDTHADLSDGAPADYVMVRRALICSMVGAIEGVAAAAVMFGVALLYHLVILDMPARVFGYGFYGVFSLLAGITYGSFSAIACGRFLSGELRLERSLSHSFFGWTAALGITLLTAFLTGNAGDLSRVTLTTGFAVGVFVLLLLRSLVQTILTRWISRGELHFEKLAVIGRRADVTTFLINGEFWRCGHVLTGTLHTEDHLDASGTLDDQAVAAFARANVGKGADHIVLLGDLADMDGLERLVETLKRFALNVVYAPATTNTSLKLLSVVAIGPNNALRFAEKPLSDGAVFVKRVMDIVLSAASLLVLSPLFAVVAVAILLESPGPVIFTQARRGFNGEVFMIWKFRSMTSTESGYEMRQAEHNDARLTRIGGILRKTSIDELPQLVNVLRGQMSLVGPRPHAVSHDDELSLRVAKYAHRQRIKPGISGWAQVNGYRGATTTMEQMEGRVLHDIYYVDNWSIFFDLWVMVLTVVSPATRRNAR